MYRKAMSRKIDKKVYRHTAARSKDINLNPIIYRGGIRL